MNKLKYLLVFGSLRKNSKRGYNFNRFGGEEYIKDVILKGYEMYSLTHYPAICEGNGTIKCELHSIEEKPAQSIERMEIGAGYTGKDLQVDLNGKKVTARIYTWPKERLEGNFPKVETGDWN